MAETTGQLQDGWILHQAEPGWVQLWEEGADRPTTKFREPTSTEGIRAWIDGYSVGLTHGSAQGRERLKREISDVVHIVFGPLFNRR